MNITRKIPALLLSTEDFIKRCAEKREHDSGSLDRLVSIYIGEREDMNNQNAVATMPPDRTDNHEVHWSTANAG